MDDSTTKRCSKCHEVKPLTEYNRKKGSSDGLNAQCKPCHREGSMAWYRNNIEREQAKKRERYAENIENERIAARERWHRDAELNHERQRAAYHRTKDLATLRERNRAYYHAHPGQRKQTDRHRYQQKRGQILAYQREYARAHRAQCNEAKKRYVLRKGHTKIHHWPALRAWFGEHCLCCGSPHRIEADHVIPLARGGSNHISNIQPLCRICNAEKATQTTDYRDPDRLAAFLAQLE